MFPINLPIFLIGEGSAFFIRRFMGRSFHPYADLWEGFLASLARKRERRRIPSTKKTVQDLDAKTSIPDPDQKKGKVEWRISVSHFLPPGPPGSGRQNTGSGVLKIDRWREEVKKGGYCGSGSIGYRYFRRACRPRAHTSNLADTGRRRPSAWLHLDSSGTAQALHPERTR